MITSEFVLELFDIKTLPVPIWDIVKYFGFDVHYNRWEGYPSYSFYNSIVLNLNYEPSVFGLCVAYELFRLINDTNKCSEHLKGIINPHEMAKYMSIDIMLPKYLLFRERSMPLKNLSGKCNVPFRIMVVRANELNRYRELRGTPYWAGIDSRRYEFDRTDKQKKETFNIFF